MSSLREQLLMPQLYERTKSVMEMIQCVAPDSLFFHTEMNKTNSELETLRQEVRAWSRLLSLGSLQAVPITSFMELQRRRARIMHCLQALEQKLMQKKAEQEVNAFGANLVQQICQQNGNFAMLPHNSSGYSINVTGPSTSTGGGVSPYAGQGTLATANFSAPTNSLPVFRHTAASETDSSSSWDKFLTFKISSSEATHNANAYPDSELSSSVSTLSAPLFGAPSGSGAGVRF